MTQPKHRILVVDDDKTLREMYAERLKHDGYEVLTATNGEEGLEIALTQQPAVILLDLMMPKKGGLGVLEVLKSQPTTEHIPVMILTAYPEEEYRDKSTRAGAAHFIAKSETTPAEVVAKVEALLRGPIV